MKIHNPHILPASPRALRLYGSHENYVIAEYERLKLTLTAYSDFSELADLWQTARDSQVASARILDAFEKDNRNDPAYDDAVGYTR